MRATFFSQCLKTLVLTILMVFILFSLPAGSAPLLAGATAVLQQQTAVTAPATSAVTSDVHALVAGLSDEQARMLLISELQKMPAEESPVFMDEIAGPGAVLGKLLHSLSSKSNSSEKKARQLLVSIPDVLPDLYRVFLTL